MIYIFKLMALCWRKQKSYMIILTGLTMIKSICPFLTLLTIQRILNNLQTGEYKETYIFMGVYIIVLLINILLESIYNYYDRCFGVQIHYDINCCITEKSRSLKLIDYENSKTYDKLMRALREAQTPPRVIKTIFSLSSRIISFIGSLALLITWNPYIIFLMLIIPCISLIFTIKVGKMDFDIKQKRSTDSRKVQYLSYLLNNANSFKENKALGIDGHLFERYKSIFGDFVKKDKRIIGLRLRYGVLFNVLEKLCGGFAIFLIIHAAMQKKIGIGNVNTYMSCVWNITRDADGIMNNIGQLYNYSLFLENLFDFLEYNETMDQVNRQKIVIKDIKSIECINVSFRYKEYLPYVLQNINLKINNQDKIAIVGENGSGKSTFVKLLAGFYHNYEGTILINGIALESIDRESLQKQMGIVFQDYVKYEFTLKENLQLGQMHKSSFDIGEVLTVLNKYDILSFYRKYKKGMDMQLGNKFDRGTELSGGEWQQIALARAVVKDADVYILDEPSASLDIGAENNIISAINETMNRKICLLITHRLYNISKFAERIIVFKDGKIVEDGCQEELLSSNSHYQTLYNNFYKKKGKVS